MKIEAASFTISEPFSGLTISPLLYDSATEEQKRILESQYKVNLEMNVDTIMHYK